MLPSLWRRSAVGLGVPLRRHALVAVSSASALATAGSWALCESPADAPTMSPNPYRDGTVSQQQADAKAEYLRKAEYLENKTPEENTEALRVWRTHVHAAREHFGRKDYAAAEASLKEARFTPRPMRNATRRRLEAFYAPHNARLAQVLGDPRFLRRG